MIGGTNVFLSRYRVVAQAGRDAGSAVDHGATPDETGRGGPSAAIDDPSRTGGGAAVGVRRGRRPVGEFEAKAHPGSVRVGEELEYRITVEGPAAWGMTGRPDLLRFDRLGLGLRVEPGPVAFVHEPPSRTFSYKLRPTRPGEAVLPPLAIAAYDPSSRHYMTRVTPSVPIRAVAVAAFDPATIPDIGASGKARMRRLVALRRCAARGRVGVAGRV